MRDHAGVRLVCKEREKKGAISYERTSAGGIAGSCRAPPHCNEPARSGGISRLPRSPLPKRAARSVQPEATEVESISRSSRRRSRAYLTHAARPPLRRGMTSLGPVSWTGTLPYEASNARSTVELKNSISLRTALHGRGRRGRRRYSRNGTRPRTRGSVGGRVARDRRLGGLLVPCSRREQLHVAFVLRVQNGKSMFMRQRNDAGHDPLPFIGGNRKGDVLGADDRVSRERPFIVRETYVMSAANCAGSVLLRSRLADAASFSVDSDGT